VPAHQSAQSLEAEPADVVTGVDGGLAQRFEEVSLARSTRPAHDQVLVTVNPLEGAQGSLRWFGD
jgi:hypothetical protein